MEQPTKIINYYKRFLSPVGCSILDFMIKNYKQKQSNCMKSNKVVIFNRDNEQNNEGDKSIVDIYPSMTTTDTTTSSPGIISCTDEVGYCNDNVSSEVKFHALSVNNKQLALQSNSHEERKLAPSISKASEVHLIEWDDMFDTELLPINSEGIEKTDDIICNVSNKRDDFDKYSLVQENHFVHCNEKKNLEIKTTIKSFRKRKSSQEIKTNVVSKKGNVCSESKIRTQKICRYQKYTNPIQNWLKNIESTVKKVDTQSSPDLIPRHKENSTKIKKCIQTQLINKNGLMKYTKNKTISNKDCLNFSDTNNSVKCDINQSENFRVIDSILLVESQLPWDVLIIDENNIHEHIKNVSTTYQEIILLLIYSDGCYQTESEKKSPSPGAPEGLFLHIISSDSHSQYYLRGKKITFPGIVKNFLKQITTGAELVCYNAKDVLKYLACWWNLQHDLGNVRFLDIKIGVSLLRADDPPESFAAVITALGVQNVSPCVDVGAVANMLRSAAVALRTALRIEGFQKLFYDIEMPIVPIIAGMEVRGIEVNSVKLKQIESSLLLELNAAETACHAAAGREFLLTSPAQVRALLYEELRLHTRLPAARFFDTTDTSENALKKLNVLHPLPNLILEFRRLHKIQTTFIAGLVQHVKNGVVSPEWLQTAATTGRIACRGPNLQAVPKVQELRAMLVARQGHVLLAADFQQMECRVFAALAADEKLMDLLTAPGDIFRLLAAQWLGRAEADVTAEERERTKRIVYAGLYGAGVRSLADMLDATYDRTLQFLTSFNRSFPSLRRFGEETVQRCVAAGGTLSLPSGRRRCLPAIMGCDAAQRAHAQRQAINFLVQGTAADLCKVAMGRAATALYTAGLDAPLLLQVHDELVWEVPQQHLRSAAEAVRPAMEDCGQALGLQLRLPVALSYGPNWGHMTTL